MDWSSSSSDEELQRDLRRNTRRMQADERALPISRSSTIVYNGENVEIKYGTIYCPFRRKHFHIRTVKRSPASFFGDANIRRSKRRCLSPSSVQLLDASLEGSPSEFKRMTLKDASDNGFYLFNDIKESFCHSSPVLHPPLLQDFRYSRIIMKNRFKENLISPVQLRPEVDGWKRSLYQIPQFSIIENLSNCRFAFCNVRQNSQLYIVENGTVLPYSVRVPGGSDDIIGIKSIGLADAMFFMKKKYLQYLVWDPDTPPTSALWSSSPEVDNVFTCFCTNSVSGVLSRPRAILASKRVLYDVTVHENFIPRPQRLCSFNGARIASIDTYSVGPFNNQVVVCGMMNGTIEARLLQELESRRSFNSRIRHNSALVSYICCVEGTFNFVSVSINGEIKLWDMRYMNKNEPVSKMETSTAGGRFHDVQASFVDDIASFTNCTGSVSCINMRRWLTLGQYQRSEGSEGRIYVVRSAFGYEIIDVGSFNTMVYPLHLVYSSGFVFPLIYI